MENIKKIGIIATAVIIVLLSIFCYIEHSLKLEYKSKYETEANNVSILLKKQTNYKINDSLNAVQINALTLSLDEYKELYSGAKKEIESLKNSDHKSIEYITKIQTKTETKWKRDTLILLKDSCRYYTDGFTTINMCKDSIYVLNTDTISQFISKHYKHKFLWWRWKMDGVTQDIYTSNPHSNIVFDRFVKVDK